MATVGDVVASRPVVAVSSLLAGVAAGVALAPSGQAPRVDVRVHALRVERPRPEAQTLRAQVYATASWAQADGGTKSRDLGGTYCAKIDAALADQLVQITNSACDAGAGAWPHVTEFAGSDDAGYALRVYLSQAIDGGGVLDLGYARHCAKWHGELPATLKSCVEVP